MRKTKAMLDAELEQWKRMHSQEQNRRLTAEDKVIFFEKYSNQGIQATMAESMAKISHALRKALEVEKTGKPSPF